MIGSDGSYVEKMEISTRESMGVFFILHGSPNPRQMAHHTSVMHPQMVVWIEDANRVSTPLLPFSRSLAARLGSSVKPDPQLPTDTASLGNPDYVAKNHATFV